MNNFFPRLDGTRVQIALKSCLALVLGFGIAFWLDWKPSFMGILIVVLQTAAVGSTFKKGLLYIVGTLSGAITGVMMVALFADDRVSFILATALLIGFGTYRLQGSRNAYAWLIFLVTFALVAWLSAQNPSITFGLAVIRVSAICLAVVLTIFVHGILWPIRAGKTFERQLHAFLDGCRNLLSLTEQSIKGNESEAGAVKKTEVTQAKLISALRNSLDAAAGDTERFKRFQPGYQQLIGQLYDLLLAVITVRESVQRSYDRQEGVSLTTGTGNLRSALATINGELEKLVRDLARPRDGSVDLVPPSGADVSPLPDIGKHGNSDTAFAAMLDEQLHHLMAQVSQVRATFSRVEDPAQTLAPPPVPSNEPFRFTSTRFRKAVTGSVVMLLVISFFILTNWPDGLELAMIFVTLTIAFNAMLPLMMIRRQLYLSLLIGPGIAAPLYFGIMPGIDRYVNLVPWLVVVFVPLFYLIQSPNPKTSMMLLFSTMFVIILMSLAEQGQSYTFSSFMTTWIALGGAFGIPLVIFALFSSLVPEREFWKQVRSFFAGCGQSMQNLATNPPTTPAGVALVKTSRQQSHGILKQLQVWSSAINYNRIPGNDQRATQDFIESIERVMLRLASAEHARRRPIDGVLEPLRKPFQRLYDACTDSFQLIANSLADLRPVPNLPDTGKLIRDIELRGAEIRRLAAGDDNIEASALRVMGVSAQLHSLADALHDCRDKANALDWRAWNRHYF